MALGAVMALAAAGLPLAPASAAPAVAGNSAAAGTGTSTITAGGWCLDDADAATGDGNPIRLYGCNGTSAQQFTWRGDGTVTVLGKCLDVTGASNASGTLVQLYGCASGAPQQKFKYLPDKTIYSVKSGKCLAVQGATAELARVGLAPCDPSKAAEQWGAPAAPTSGYTLSSGKAVEFTNPDDIPAVPFTDRNGQFYYQQSHALYGAKDSRQWDFYTGTDFDHVGLAPVSNASDPANPADSNADTTWRCNNSPTGRTATNAPAPSGYSQRNFCDLSGVWVDPDTGWWYGLVHNEFTPQPFGDGLHYDAIDYALSKDRGATWTIQGHAITSPYSTARGDTTAFPHETYYYGDGDQRLFVDNASGYFYVFYATRVLDKSGGGTIWLQHVARAPMAQKMASASWSKWYDGAWRSPGVGGAESDIIPSEGLGSGYLAPGEDYKPATSGTVADQVARGAMPDHSQLAVMNVAWSAYLGKYIGTPQNNVAQATDTRTPLHFYVTDDLATQKWTDMGLVADQPNAAWYRWMLDPANLTSSTVVGRTFRSYCAFYCSTYTSEYADITIAPRTPSDLPAPVTPGASYRIGTGGGLSLAQSGSGLTAAAPDASSPAQQWRFDPTGDGFFTVSNAASNQALAVATGDAGRAWGAGVTAAAPTSNPAVGLQWSVQPVVTASDGSGPSAPTGAYRLVNRYSGLVLSLGSGAQAVTTAPVRAWDNRGTGGDTRPAAGQLLSLVPTGRADLALNRPTTASSVQSSATPASAAVDGDGATRWSSQFADPQWIQVDLGAVRRVSEVTLTWEAAYGKAYQIQVSDDAKQWTTIGATTSSDGGVDDLNGLSGSGRYLRVLGTRRATGYGYSLWSLQVYGA
ncbi:ricin-type beta-trefoil lectin domain protein [Streptomyces sp. SDr-06]|uniref:ricin-type beta-trefoil lectin domain protein n=1 Tax=Streptomyces sp. SDr-06 TaxID=2267702 RepID=UPI001672105A|nr:ricin-type beta-trefoil lectin domain protein [Streptomyces sp. SDr-06]